MPKSIFALNGWSVEQRGEYWWYGDTYRDRPDQFRGPYSSMTSVALMIAREMTKEIVRRKDRLAPSMASVPAE
jgi:hypothetical protein